MQASMSRSSSSPVKRRSRPSGSFGLRMERTALSTAKAPFLPSHREQVAQQRELDADGVWLGRFEPLVPVSRHDAAADRGQTLLGQRQGLQASDQQSLIAARSLSRRDFPQIAFRGIEPRGLLRLAAVDEHAPGHLRLDDRCPCLCLPERLKGANLPGGLVPDLDLVLMGSALTYRCLRCLLFSGDRCSDRCGRSVRQKCGKISHSNGPSRACNPDMTH